MAIYDLDEYKQQKVSKEMYIKKTELTTWMSKPRLKVGLPIAIVGLTYILFIGFASLLIRWHS